MIRKRSLLLAFAAASILALGTVFVVTGQTPGPTPSEGSRADRFIERLASNLGISSDRLKTAIKDTGTQIVDEKLAAGEITQEQADKAKQRIAEGKGRGLAQARIARRGGDGHKGLVNINAAVSEILGVDLRTLLSEMKAGKSIAQIAQEHGKTKEQVKTAVLAKLTTKLDEQVGAGRLTAEQKQSILDRVSGQLDRLLDRTLASGRPGGARVRPSPTPTAPWENSQTVLISPQATPHTMRLVGAERQPSVGIRRLADQRNKQRIEIRLDGHPRLPG